MANISKQKRDRMIEFLETLKKEHTDDESIRAFTEIENQLRDKKYGLVWEEHTERVDEMLAENIPVFTEDIEKKIIASADGAYNFILEGDNLQSLYLLQKTHKGLIDIIYIDPPYNTGKQFIYDDRNVDKDDAFKHSKWLSFMNVRMKLAKELLSERGIIFISIDDHEQATLRLLCDEIFGQDSFVAAMPRLTKKAGKNQQGGYAQNHDYLYCYSNYPNNLDFTKKEAPETDYPLVDEFYETRGGYKLNQTLDYDTLGYVYSLDYPIEIDGEKYFAGGVSEEEYQQRKQTNPRDGFRWRWSPEKFHFGYDNGFIVVKKSRNGTRIYTKTYFKAKIERKDGGYYINTIDRTIPPTTLDYTDNAYSNDNAKKNIDAFQLSLKFDYSKPVSLIQNILSLYPNKDAIVLDFFAGSGTTAQAVLEQNVIDDGHRTFIICTDNSVNPVDEIDYFVRKGYIEKPPKKNAKNKYAEWLDKFGIFKDGEHYIETIESDEYKELGICHGITYPRIKTTITGKRSNGTIFSDGIPANLKYFKCDWIPRKPEDYLLSNALCLHIREMIELQQGIEIDNVRNVLILNKADFRKYIMDDSIYPQIENIWVNQNIIFNSDEMERLNALGFKYIPREFFGQELREAAE